VPPPDAVALDPECEIGLEAEGHARAARVSDVPVAVGRRPLGGGAAVVEDRLAHELDLDVAVDTFDDPDEHVVGVVVRRRAGVRRDRVLVVPRADRQRVANGNPARGRLPRRLEHVRAGHIGHRRWVDDAERAKAEEAGLAVEQAPEHARRVEARNAEPTD
jgi:hypothetical protein